MATSPPLPPSPSLDDLFIPPTPPSPTTVNISDQCVNFIPDNASLDIFPPIDSLALAYERPPIEVLLRSSTPPPDGCYVRGRSRSRSPPPRRRRSASPGCRYSPIPICGPPVIITGPSLYDSSPSRSSSPVSSRSPSPRRPRRRRYSYRSRTPSPMRRSYTYSPPQIIYPPPPPPILPVPNYISPPSPIPPITWPPAANPIPEAVDILTFQYNNNMAYAPAAKTYDVCLFVSSPTAIVIPTDPCNVGGN